jgi:hypothetical protein
MQMTIVTADEFGYDVTPYKRWFAKYVSDKHSANPQLNLPFYKTHYSSDGKALLVSDAEAGG